MNVLRLHSTNGMKISPQSGGLFSQATSGPVAFGQGVRLNRYRTYEAIVANINYCYRALQVLVDNILSPDDITKRSLDIKPRTDNVKENEEVKVISIGATLSTKSKKTVPNEMPKNFDLGFSKVSENDGKTYEVVENKTGTRRWKLVK